MNKIFIALAALATGTAVFLAAQGQTFSHADAGGVRLRLLSTGSGDPTVVFESGAGGPLEVWCRVQPAVSRFARTISYDRAGNGLSEKGPVPRDGRRIANELHAALRSAKIPPPYILVGHSLGGPYVRLFAALYPNEVAALVLVDPTQEELIAWAKTRKPKPSAEPRFRPDDEVDCFPATVALLRDHPVPTNLPVFLIAGQGPRTIPDFLSPELREEVRKDQEIFYPAKLKFYQAWMKPFSQGELIVTENSGHGIPFEEPELVISTIRNAVETARRR